MRCSYCGSGQHTINLCPKTASGQSNRRNLHCSYCGSNRHDIVACPKTFSGNAARAWYPEQVADHFRKD